ncbi:MAG: phosphoribosylglycinamide formyltransferase [Lachnospiraceae bacterium]|nr:phosphoribosylglycinamide formyltransferase [Lachnospiraceae bacterium]
MLKIVVCVSGGGTNLQAIIDGVHAGSIPNVEILRVISNNSNAYALERAKQAGIEGICVSPHDYPDREQFNEALLKAVDEVSPDLIVLAGFLVEIPPQLIKEYENKIINIHPSLIPSFCGKGYYGLKVHEAVLERGVKVTGATVHFVDEGMDTGPIIMQKAVQVLQRDTPETLQQRVMEEAEWVILPWSLALIAAGAVTVADGRVQIAE